MTQFDKHNKLFWFTVILLAIVVIGTFIYAFVRVQTDRVNYQQTSLQEPKTSQYSHLL